MTNLITYSCRLKAENRQLKAELGIPTVPNAESLQTVERKVIGYG